jgi:hypothetical protein
MGSILPLCLDLIVEPGLMGQQGSVNTARDQLRR